LPQAANFHHSPNTPSMTVSRKLVCGPWLCRLWSNRKFFLLFIF